MKGKLGNFALGTCTYAVCTFTPKTDKSTDMFRECDSDRERVQKSKNIADVICAHPFCSYFSTLFVPEFHPSAVHDKAAALAR